MSTIQEHTITRTVAAPRRPGFAIAGDLVLAVVVLVLLLTTPLLDQTLSYLGSAFSTDVAQITALIVPGG